MTTRNIVLSTLAATTSLALTLAISQAAVASPRDASPAHRSATSQAQTASYIVQAQSLAMARTSVQQVGGTITHELGIIEAVGAQLTVAQADALRADRTLILSADASTKVAGYAGQPYVVRQTMANALHAVGITGKGVSIAFVDTGLWSTPRSPRTPPATGSSSGYDAIRNMRVLRSPTTTAMARTSSASRPAPI